MPAPLRKKTPPAPPRVATKVQTQISTKTKVAIIGVGLLALGLAAHGFGFLPGVDVPKDSMEKEQQEEQIANKPKEESNPDYCRAGCTEEYDRCVNTPDTNIEKCRIAADYCEERCAIENPDTDTPPTQPPAPACALAIEPMGLTTAERGDGILVAGNDAWHPLARYQATASSDTVTIERVRVLAPMNAASFTEVAIAQNGRIHGSNVLPAGGHLSAVDIELAESNRIRVNPGTPTAIEIWGKLAPLVPSVAVAGTANYPRAGAIVKLEIQGYVTNEPWGPLFADKFNIGAQCETTPDLVFADYVARPGTTMTVFKSKPTVRPEPLTTAPLASDIRTNLYRFRISADPAGAVALKKIVLEVEKNFTQASTTIGAFRLQREGEEIPLDDYRIFIDAARTDGRHEMLGRLQSYDVTILFQNEQIISGSGGLFTLSGIITGDVTPGDRVRISRSLFHPTGLHSIGFLTGISERGSVIEGVVGPNIDTHTTADGTAEAGAHFIWSDLSEIPHSNRAGTDGGSRDWIVGDHSRFHEQTLSR